MSARSGRTVVTLLRVLGALAAAVVLVVVAAGLALTNTDWGHREVRRIALGALRGAVHGVVRIGGIDGDLLDHLVLTDVSITDSSGAPFLSARRIDAYYSVLDLLRQRLDLRHVHLDSTTVVLRQAADQSWNYTRLFAAANATPSTAHTGWGSWLRLSDVHITDADLTIRTRWHPDSLLRGAARDSAIQAALAQDSRVDVAAVADGFEQTSSFHHLTGTFPAVDLSEPGRTTSIIRVAALSGDLAAFRPPVVAIRDLNGTFYFAKDSLWWSKVRLARPAARFDNGGAYGFETHDLRAQVHLDSTMFADLRFLDPHLPTEGRAAADVAIEWRGRAQRYRLRNLTAYTGRARLAGRLGITLNDSLSLQDTDLQFSGIDQQTLAQVVPTVRPSPKWADGVVSGRAIASGGLHSLTVNADVTYETPGAAPSHVRAEGQFGLAATGQSTGFRGDHLTVTLAPLQVALVHRAVPSLPIGGEVTGHLTLDGSTTGPLTVSADLVHQEGGAESHLTGDGQIDFGPNSRPRRVNLSATVEPLALSTVGRFVPTAKLGRDSGATEDGHHAGTVSAQLRVVGRLDSIGVHAEIALAAPDSGTLAVDGHLDLSAPPIGYDLVATAVRFDAHALSAAAPSTNLSATVRAHGRGTTPATLASTLDADMSASTIDRFAIDSVRLRATVDNGQLHVDTALVRAATATAEVHGAIGVERGHGGTLTYRLAIDSLSAFRELLPPDTESVIELREPIAAAVARARADSAELAEANEVERAIRGTPAPTLVVDTPPTLRRNSLAGRVLATGTVQGTIQSFEIRGDLVADSLVALGNAARRARAFYAGRVDNNQFSPGAVAIRLRAATIGGFAMDSMAVRATYRHPDGTLQLAVYQDSLREYRLNSEFRNTPADWELRYDSLVFRFDTTIWSAPQPGSVDWTPNHLEFHRLELTNGPTGRILVNGVVPMKPGLPATLQVTIHDLDMQDARQLAESDLPLRGRLSMQASLSGSSDTPRLQGSASLIGGTVGNRTLPDTHLTFGYDSAAFHAHGQLAAAATPWAPFADADATVPIKIGLGGPSPRLMEGPLKGEMRLDSLPIDVLPAFISSLRDLGGLVTGRVTVGGTVGHPKAQGQVAIERGSVTVVATGTALRDVAGHIQVDGDSVVFDSLVARTPSTGGRFRLAGWIDRMDPALTALHLTLTADNARAVDTRDLGHIDVDATLTLAGPTTAPFLYGNAKIHNAVYYIPISNGKQLVNISDPTVYLVANLSNPATRAVIPSEITALSHALMTVEISVERNSWVRNPDANIEVYTVDPVVLRIDRQHRAIVVEGTVNSDRGQYTFMSKRFNITKGLATFAGTPELNPSLQGSGSYQIPVPGRQPITIQFLIAGKADSLQLTLTSNAQPPISQSTLLTYLAFSSPSSGISQQTESTSLTGTGNGGNVVGTASTFVQAQLTSTALGVLASEGSGALGRALGADVLNITTGNLYTDIGQHNEAATVLQTTQIEYGKYVTPQTYVALQVSVAPGGRVVHEVGKDLSVSIGLEPLYLLGPATLSQTTITPLTGVLGLTLTRTWRF